MLKFRNLSAKLILFLITFCLIISINITSANAALDNISQPVLSSEFLTNVAYGNNQYIAISSSGMLYASLDGISWSVRSTGSNVYLRDIIYANNQYLAIGNSGTILSSVDGITWTSRTSGVSSYLSGITYANNKFVIVGFSIAGNSPILTSPDGITWTSRTSGTTEYLIDVTYGNNQYVAIGSNAIFTSSDGVTWTNRTTTLGGQSITFGNNQFVIVGKYGTNTILTSPNGITWTTRTSSNYQLETVTYGNGLYIASGDSGGIYTSVDGITWTSRISGTTNNLYGVVKGNLYVTVGASGTVLTSPDGVIWTSRNTINAMDFYSIAYGNNLYVAVGSSGRILTSPDRITWMPRTSGTTNTLKDIIYSNNQFIVIGSAGTILTSPDGITWTKRTSGVTNTLYAIARTSTQYVITSEYDSFGLLILMSTDGVNWTEYQQQACYPYIYDIAYGNNHLVAVGNNTFLTADVGNYWIIKGSPGVAMYSVAYGNNQFVAVGAAGYIFTSPNGMGDWTARSSGTTKNLKSVIYADNQFVAVGASGTILTSSDGIVWIASPVATNNELNTVCANNHQYVIMGTATTIMTASFLDNIPPAIDPIQNPSTPTSGSAIITANVSDPSGVQVTKWASGNVTTSYFTTGGTTFNSTFTVSDNGTYTIYAKDTLGNATTKTVVVSNIDRTPPAAPTLSTNITLPTNGNVTVTITYSSDSVIKQYKVGVNGNWAAYTVPIIISTNDTVYARGIDAAGNISDSSLAINNIDKTAPVAPTLSIDKTIPTNGNVTVTIIYPADANVKQYKIGAGSWTNYSSPVVLSSNGTVYAQCQDSAGNWSSQGSMAVSNIDKTPPVITIAPYSTDPVCVVTVTASTNEGTLNTTSHTFTTNESFDFVATDAVGNVTTKTVTITNIIPDAVAPAVPGNLVCTGKTHTTATLMWNASSDNVAVTGYKIFRNGTETGTSDTPGYTDTGLSPVTSYTYTVKAYDAAGNISDPSSQVIIATEEDPCMKAPPFAAGNYNTLALLNNGTVKAWGYNYYGQLGLGDNINRSTPILVPHLSSVKQLVSGRYHTIALMNDGTVKAWGQNTYGQLGLGDTTNRNSPVAISGLSGVKQLVAGSLYSLALMDDGTVKVWGHNNYGQLGLGDTTNRNAPVDITGLTGVKQLVAGSFYTLALMNDGTVKAWGQNSYGQLGLGNTANQTSPTDIPGLSGVKQLATGYYHALALLNNGTVKAWGYNGYGQLGLGDTTNRTSPANITGFSEVLQLYSGYNHSAALINGGTAKVWGQNNYGQLGLGDTTNRNVPAAIAGLAGVKQLSAGYYHTLAIMEDDTAKAWGWNNYGQLGIGNTTDQNAPAVITDLDFNTPGDTQAPSAPTGLTSPSRTDTTINLSWTASADNVGVTGYDIYNGTSLAGSTTGETSFTVTGLTAGTTYNFTVKAKDDVGNVSEASSTLTVTTTDTEAPTVPANLSCLGVTDTSADLIWDAATDNAWVEGYKIYRDGLEIATTGTCEYTDILSTTGASYVYIVKAYDAAGNISEASNELIVTLGGSTDTEAPTEPANLFSLGATTETVDLMWDGSTDNVGVEGYKIYRDGVEVGMSSTTDFSDTGLSPGTTYIFTIKAYDSAGNLSDPSMELSVTTEN